MDKYKEISSKIFDDLDIVLDIIRGYSDEELIHFIYCITLGRCAISSRPFLNWKIITQMFLKSSEDEVLFQKMVDDFVKKDS